MAEIWLTSWGWKFIPLFPGFYTSQVVQDFFHRQYHWLINPFLSVKSYVGGTGSTCKRTEGRNKIVSLTRTILWWKYFCIFLPGPWVGPALLLECSSQTWWDIGLLSNSSYLLDSSQVLVSLCRTAIKSSSICWKTGSRVFNSFFSTATGLIAWWDPSSTLPISMHFKSDWQVDPHKKASSFPAWPQTSFGIFIQMTCLTCQCSRGYFGWMALSEFSYWILLRVHLKLEPNPKNWVWCKTHYRP